MKPLYIKIVFWISLLIADLVILGLIFYTKNYPYLSGMFLFAGIIYNFLLILSYLKIVDENDILPYPKG